MTRTLLLTALVTLAPQARAQEPAFTPSLETLRPLVGEWRGVGQGRWGEFSAECSFAFVLDGRFLQNRGLGVYPRQEKNEDGEIHRTLDLFSFDQRRETLVLRELDNEGFATTYYMDRSASSPQRLVFLAEHLENVPEGWGARITYELLGDDEYHETFELDTDERGFRHFLRIRFLRLPEGAASP
jgi:hypothetical protein